MDTRPGLASPDYNAAERHRTSPEREADTMHAIYTHVAQGGTLAGLAKLWTCRFGYLSAWVQESAARRDLYKRALEERAEWQLERVFEEIRNVAFGDPADLYGNDGQLLPMHEIPEAARSMIAGLDTEELFDGQGRERTHVGFVKKLKRWDKIKALEMLARDAGRLVQKHDVAVHGTLEDLVVGSKPVAAAQSGPLPVGLPPPSPEPSEPA